MNLLAQLRGAPRTIGTDARATLLLLGAVACIVAPHFGHLPIWAIVVTLGAFAGKVWLAVRGRPGPNAWMLAAITAAVGAATTAQYGTLLGREAGVTLLVMLICVKLLEMRARRDVFVVIFLGFFVALCQFLTSQAIPTAIFVGLGTVMLMTALVGEHLTGDAGESPPPGLRVALRIALRAFAFAVPLTLAMFVLFPRLPGPLWGSPDSGRQGGTGLSDSMSPGAIAQLAESDAIAFRVRFDGVPPPERALYFRAVVFGAFDGRTWRENPRTLRTVPPPWRVEPLGPLVHYAMTIEPHSRPWLFTLEHDAQPPTLSGTARPTIARAAADGTWVVDRGVVRDRLVLHGTAATRARVVPPETRLSIQEWIDLPAGFNPRTLELAAQWRRTTEEPHALVARALQMFRDEPFRYTLEPPPLSDNTVDGFLFDTRAGFCEHYASAFVVLMRALDIPARVVTGYQGGEFNPVDGVLEVRQRDAHAWAEVWLGDAEGWVRVDPTAAVSPLRVEHGVRAALPRPAGVPGLLSFGDDSFIVTTLRGLRHRWDAVENTWNQWVLGYNADAQRDLFGRLGMPDANWRDLMLAMMGALGVLSAGMTLRLLARRPVRDPWLRRYAALEARLARAGLERAPHEGPAQWRVRITTTLDAQHAAQVLRILDALVRLRYGVVPQDATDLRTVTRWIASLDLPRSRFA